MRMLPHIASRVLGTPLVIGQAKLEAHRRGGGAADASVQALPCRTSPAWNALSRPWLGHR